MEGRLHILSGVVEGVADDIAIVVGLLLHHGVRPAVDLLQLRLLLGLLVNSPTEKALGAMGPLCPQ
jgi:hypothetical protein